MNECIRPCLYDAYHHVDLLSRRHVEKLANFDVVGPVCESADFVGKAIPLPIPTDTSWTDAESDAAPVIVGVFDVGAYCMSMASNYNLRLRPTEILVKQDGEIEKFAERERLEAVLSRFKLE